MLVTHDPVGFDLRQYVHDQRWIEIEKDGRGLREVVSLDVTRSYSYPITHARLPHVGSGSRCDTRIYLNSDGTTARLTYGLDQRSPVAASQIVKQIFGGEIQGRNHHLNDVMWR